MIGFLPSAHSLGGAGSLAHLRGLFERRRLQSIHPALWWIGRTAVCRELPLGNALLTASNASATQRFLIPFRPSGYHDNHRVLIGTRGFSDRNLIAPDFVVPDRFVPIPDGSITLANYDSVSYVGPAGRRLSCYRYGRPRSAGQWGRVEFDHAGGSGQLELASLRILGPAERRRLGRSLGRDRFHDRGSLLSHGHVAAQWQSADCGWR
jgi:hypothetical protein